MSKPYLKTGAAGVDPCDQSGRCAVDRDYRPPISTGVLSHCGSGFRGVGEWTGPQRVDGLHPVFGIPSLPEVIHASRARFGAGAA
jgi:hypothetical protein